MKVRDIAPFGMRMPGETKDWIKSRALKNKRSANKEALTIFDFARQADKLGMLDRFMQEVQQ